MKSGWRHSPFDTRCTVRIMWIHYTIWGCFCLFVCLILILFLFFVCFWFVCFFFICLVCVFVAVANAIWLVFKEKQKSSLLMISKNVYTTIKLYPIIISKLIQYLLIESARNTTIYQAVLFAFICLISIII